MCTIQNTIFFSAQFMGFKPRVWHLLEGRKWKRERRRKKNACIYINQIIWKFLRIIFVNHVLRIAFCFVFRMAMCFFSFHCHCLCWCSLLPITLVVVLAKVIAWQMKPCDNILWVYLFRYFCGFHFQLEYDESKKKKRKKKLKSSRTSSQREIHRQLKYIENALILILLNWVCGGESN